MSLSIDSMCMSLCVHTGREVQVPSSCHVSWRRLPFPVGMRDFLQQYLSPWFICLFGPSFAPSSSSLGTFTRFFFSYHPERNFMRTHEHLGWPARTPTTISQDASWTLPVFRSIPPYFCLYLGKRASLGDSTGSPAKAHTSPDATLSAAIFLGSLLLRRRLSSFYGRPGVSSSIVRDVSLKRCF